MSPAPAPANQFDIKVMRDYIAAHCGITLPPEKDYLLEARLAPLMAETGCASLTALVLAAERDAARLLRDRIVDAMTTQETLWFRDRHPFDLLARELLPRFAAQFREGRAHKLRIWSAACATGQEPYSIAMTVLEFSRENGAIPPERVEILATDVSLAALFSAKSGRYDAFSLGRGLPAEMRERHFRPDGDAFLVSDRVRSLVAFSRLNLLESFAAVGAADIIFCRNVLIYFADSFKRDILARMAAALRPGGALIVGACESLGALTDAFAIRSSCGGFYYERSSDAAARPGRTG